MNIVYGYARVSSLEQVENQHGIQAQQRSIDLYVEQLLARRPELKWGGMFIDEGVSAYSKRLIERPAGGKLDRAVKPGDHVVFARIDRGFRWLPDFRMTLEAWDKRDVYMHFTDMGIDFSSAAGRLIGNMLAAVAEWYSDFISERMKEVHANRRLKGGNSVRRGFKLSKPKGMKIGVAVEDRKERAVFRWIMHARYVQKLTRMETAEKLEAIYAKREGRKPYSRFHYDKWPKHPAHMDKIAATARLLWPGRYPPAKRSGKS